MSCHDILQNTTYRIRKKLLIFNKMGVCVFMTDSFLLRIEFFAHSIWHLKQLMALHFRSSAESTVGLGKCYRNKPVGGD